MKRSIIITGVKEIDRKLRTLEPRIQKKRVRKAIRDGLKPILAEVKSQVPVLSGLTEKNVQLRAVKKRKRGAIELEVKIGGSDDRLYKTSKDGTKVFYPAIVEYKYDPFMRRSFTAQGEFARITAMESLWAGIEQEVKS